MQTNIPNVFAAGDVVSFPVALLNGDRSSIHHQQVAEAHGETAQPPQFPAPLGDGPWGNGAEGTAGSGEAGGTSLRTYKEQKYFLYWIITGHIAALNMLKKEKDLHTVPFFWTTMLGKSIRYAGRRGQRDGNHQATSQPTCSSTHWVWGL